MHTGCLAPVRSVLAFVCTWEACCIERYLVLGLYVFWDASSERSFSAFWKYVPERMQPKHEYCSVQLQTATYFIQPVIDFARLQVGGLGFAPVNNISWIECISYSPNSHLLLIFTPFTFLVVFNPQRFLVYNIKHNMIAENDNE